MSDYGELIGRDTVRFTRVLPGPIERVWSYLVESDKRARWLCAGEMELQVGGKVDLLFHNATLSDIEDDAPPEKYATMNGEILFHGKVTRCEPPVLLAHTWIWEDHPSEVCYELAAQDDKVRLTVTHSRMRDTEEVASACGGWHVHLGILADVLGGRERRAFWRAHAALEGEYEKRLQA